jgi:hypothetical protein
MNGKSSWTVCSLAVAMIVGLSACSGVPSQPTQTAHGSSGTVAAFLTDAPADGVVAFSIEVTGAALVGSNGVSTNISRGVQKIEMRHLQLAPTLAFQASGVPSGNFTALEMTFANPQITLADAQGNVTILNATSNPSVRLASVAVNQPISMVLQVTGSAGLAIDFDLRQSVQMDANGNYAVTPVVNVSAVTDSITEPSIENAEGTVVSIAALSSVNLQLHDTGQIVHVVTNDNTMFAADAGQFTSMETGQDIEVDAQFQGDGSFLATRIDSVSSDPPLCFSGVVAGIIQDASGNASVEVVVQE